jgi:hypothetical protein
VVVVSDPSAQINAMLDRPDNRAFVGALFDGADRVALDYSHTARLPPLALAVLLLRESVALQLLATGLLGGGIALWARWPALRGAGALADLRGALGRGTAGADPRLDAAAAAAFLRRRHPAWDEERIERVARTRGQARTDESARDADASGSGPEREPSTRLRKEITAAPSNVAVRKAPRENMRIRALPAGDRGLCALLDCAGVSEANGAGSRRDLTLRDPRGCYYLSHLYLSRIPYEK